MTNALPTSDIRLNAADVGLSLHAYMNTDRFTVVRCDVMDDYTASHNGNYIVQVSYRDRVGSGIAPQQRTMQCVLSTTLINPLPVLISHIARDAAEHFMGPHNDTQVPTTDMVTSHSLAGTVTSHTIPSGYISPIIPAGHITTGGGGGRTGGGPSMYAGSGGSEPPESRGYGGLGGGGYPGDINRGMMAGQPYPRFSGSVSSIASTPAYPTSTHQTGLENIDIILVALQERMSVSTQLDFDGTELSSTTRITLTLTSGKTMETEFTGDSVNLMDLLDNA